MVHYLYPSPTAAILKYTGI